MKIQEIISKLEYYDGKFPREALEAAIEKKEEIVAQIKANIGPPIFPQYAGMLKNNFGKNEPGGINE